MAWMTCDACSQPKPSAKPQPTVPSAARADGIAKVSTPVKQASTPVVKTLPVRKVSTPVKQMQAADPLPQRNVAPRAPAKMFFAGLVYADNSNPASRWAERPVERLNVSHCREAEEEDPDLACYLWNPQKAGRPQQLIPKWGVAM